MIDKIKSKNLAFPLASEKLWLQQFSIAYRMLALISLPYFIFALILSISSDSLPHSFVVFSVCVFGSYQFRHSRTASIKRNRNIQNEFSANVVEHLVTSSLSQPRYFVVRFN